MTMQFYRSTAIAALLATAAAAPALGQSSINESGELRSGDDELPSGEYFDTYPFEARAGDTVDARLTSGDFDSYLILRGPADYMVENDDEEGSDQTHSRIRETLPSDGTYRLAVTSYEPGETGDYRLQAQIGSGRSAAGPRSHSGTLEAGDSQLPAGEYYDAYTIDGTAGTRVTISMQSNEFDAYLAMTGPDDANFQNDDAEDGNSNSRLEVTLPANGRYRLLATSYEAGESGAYTVSAQGAELIPEGSSSSNSANNSSGNSSSGIARLPIGTPVTGQLSSSDPQLDSGEYFDVFTLNAEPGTQVAVTLESSSIDTYLAAFGANDFTASNDDDTSGSNGTNSRLELTIPADGELTVSATSYAGGETGTYTISANLVGMSAQMPGGNGPALRLGQNISGTLSSSDPRGSTSVEDSYLLEATAGQSVRLAVASDDFDTVLRVEGPGGFSTENDDQAGGGSLNSLVETTLPRSGTYRVTVASYANDGLGNYSLQTSGDAAPASSNAPGSLAIGRQVNGTLASGDDTIPSGEFYDAYQFEGTRGQQVTFDLTSSDFDTYLSLLFPGGGQEENDDATSGDGDTNSRLTVTLPADGVYQLVATSYQAGETGQYSLSVSASTAVAATIDPRRGSSRVFALSVGVADYGGRAGSLNLTDQDATKLTQTLRATGMLASQSVTLINRQATRDNFVAAIDDIAANIGPDDLFLLFFSGHGSKTPVERYMERDGSSETIELFDTAVTDFELAQMIDPIQARTLLVLDSCFSGGFDDVINRRTGRMGVFSSDSDLTSLVASKFEAGGYISHILQQALEGRADSNSDSAITAGELSEYMRNTFYQIALAEPLRASTFGAGGSRAQGYQHIVVNRGGDGMPYEEVLLNLGSSRISEGSSAALPVLALAD